LGAVALEPRLRALVVLDLELLLPVPPDLADAKKDDGAEDGKDEDPEEDPGHSPSLDQTRRSSTAATMSPVRPLSGMPPPKLRPGSRNRPRRGSMTLRWSLSP